MRRSVQLGDVDRALGKLSAREEQVLRLRFGIGTARRDADEVGVSLGVSEGWVRHLEWRALSRLRADAARDPEGRTARAVVPGHDRHDTVGSFCRRLVRRRSRLH